MIPFYNYIDLLHHPSDVMRAFIMERTSSDVQNPVCVNYAAQYCYTLKNLLLFLGERNNNQLLDACKYNIIYVKCKFFKPSNQLLISCFDKYTFLYTFCNYSNC